jgi:hypothetical protein
MIYDENEPPPHVDLDRMTRKAKFTFRNKTYELPGTFARFGDAQKLAYEQCRSMGWLGK